MGKIGAFLKTKDKKTTYYFVPYYPIGFIMYLSTTFNPNGVYIGKWEQITDVFLYACGPKHKAGETGGEEKHTLTIDELPEHSFQERLVTNGKAGGGNFYAVDPKSIIVTNTGDIGVFGNTNTIGKNQPHNNMPPYRAVYAWERVA